MIQGSPLALNPHFKAHVELKDHAGTGGRHVYTHSSQLCDDLPNFPLRLMATRYITLRFLLFPCFHIGSETQFSISMMKLGGHGG